MLGSVKFINIYFLDLTLDLLQKVFKLGVWIYSQILLYCPTVLPH